jgi:glutathione S-transferase
VYAVPGFHKDADAFNCIQRAHQNTLESMWQVLIATFACGLVYPVAAACSGTVYMLGRVVYGYGYAMGNPAYRTPGGILSHLGDMPLMGMALRIAYNAVVGNKALFV